MTSYSTLDLGKIMMHQITRAARDAPFELTLTEEPVDMTLQNREFLRNRLIDALRSRDLPIIEDSSISSPTPARVRSIWADEAVLVDESRQMAIELRDRQPGTSLPGLLLVATAVLNGGDFLIVAKIEHSAAIRIETQTNGAGHQVFVLERLRDLVFSDAAKVYKVAAFSRAASSGGALSGDVADVQNRGGFANYYLSTFLGMKLRDEPAVLTEQYLQRMTQAINESQLPPEAKLDAQSALVSELASNSGTVDPRGFIRDHVADGFQAELARLAEHAGAPMSQFPKDTSQVSSKLKRLRLDYSNDIMVIAPPDAVGEGKAVSISSDDSGADTIVITGGRLGDVRGNGSR